MFLASGVCLLFNHLGWRIVFAFGVVPIICVIVGRYRVKASDRFLHLRQVRAATEARAASLERYRVNLSEVTKVTLRQLFGTIPPVNSVVVLVTDAPAGGLVDRTRKKHLLLAICIGLIAAGALVIAPVPRRSR